MTAVDKAEMMRFFERMRPKLGEDKYVDVVDYLDFNEWPLAIGSVADYLDDRDEKMSADEWDTFKRLATSQGLNSDDYWYMKPGSGT